MTVRVVRATSISGKITRPDGAPAAGTLVIAEGFAHQPASGRSRTAADGSFTIELPPEQAYAVCIADPEWAVWTRYVFVGAGQPVRNFDLTLERGIVIQGRVTGGEPPQPAAGLAVTLTAEMPDALPGGQHPMRHAPVRVAETDHNGHYEFRVGPGVYWLMGPAPPGGDSSSDLLQARNGQDIERNLRLASVSLPGRTVRGVVRSRQPDGPPISRAIVVSAPIEPGISPTAAFTDHDGRFELPGSYRRVLVYASRSVGESRGVHDRRG